MSRRIFIKNILQGVAGVTLLGGLYSWQVEPFLLEFVHTKMVVKNLPQQLVDKTLMQISDIHIGDSFNYQYIIDAFIKAQAWNPDFVVYTGDYITYKREKQFSQLREVLPYFVKGTLATIGVLGNHDYGRQWKDSRVASIISESLTDNGIVVLRNQQQEVHGLTFIGFDDYWGPNFHPQEVMEHYQSSKPSIVLCHNPDVCDLDVWNNYQGWILAGHTHGGQCKPPFLPPLILPVKNKRYSAGEISLGDGRQLYINRAVGHLIQVRCNVRPEITIFRLQQA
jgi:predicted MPP superfamily phosphohydrolase